MLSTNVQGVAADVTAVLRRWVTSLRRLGLRRREPSAQARRPAKEVRSFIRARAGRILVEERVVYAQMISHNASSSLDHPPTGRVRISIPYDGSTCFGTDARADAEKVCAEATTVAIRSSVTWSSSSTRRPIWPKCSD